MHVKSYKLYFFVIGFFCLSKVKCSNDRGWAWTCDELENMHTEIQDNYSLFTLFKKFLKIYKIFYKIGFEKK